MHALGGMAGAQTKPRLDTPERWTVAASYSLFATALLVLFAFMVTFGYGTFTELHVLRAASRSEASERGPIPEGANSALPLISSRSAPARDPTR